MAESNLEVALTKNICPACASQIDGDIVMNTLLTPRAAKQVKELHGKATGWKFCPECQAAKDAGAVFLVEIDPDKSKINEDGKINLEGAYRTGRIWGITRDAFCRIFDAQEAQDDIVFIDKDVADKIGLVGTTVPPTHPEGSQTPVQSSGT